VHTLALSLGHQNRIVDTHITAALQNGTAVLVVMWRRQLASPARRAIDGR
jgi:uncharacterized membrane protein